MEAGCPVRARAEITGKVRRGGSEGAEKDKGRMSGEICSVTGRIRDNAPGGGQASTAVEGRSPGAGSAQKYSYDSLKVLQWVWAVSGGRSPCC